MTPAADPFEEHYNAPVVRVSAAPARAGAPPPEAYALGGCVLTPDTTIDPSWVVVDGNDIAYVGSDWPDGVRGIETGGVILPGLIDLHGHPNWNLPRLGSAAPLPEPSGLARQRRVPGLGRLAVGRPADILVLEREHEDAYESVCRSGRDSVEMVVIGGRLVYGRDDWFRALAPAARAFSAADPTASGESVWAWGKRMRLDLGSPTDPADDGEETPVPRHLAGIRAELLDRYRRIGPIFA